MSAGHTPGPWFTKHEGFSTIYVEARIGGGWIQEVAACGPTAAGNQEANARLIASAPDLLAERDRLKAANAELANVLTFCVAALRHALAVMPINDPLLRKTEAIEQAGRAVLAKHNEVKS